MHKNSYIKIGRIQKINVKVKKRIEQTVTDDRKCFLYNTLLSYLESIYDEDTLYNVLISLGFTEAEIEYEGLTPANDKNAEILHPNDKTFLDSICCITSDLTEDCKHCKGCNHCDEDKNLIKVSCDNCGGCDCEDAPNSCCNKKVIDETKCVECDGCCCDGECGSHPCNCNKNN